MPPISLVFILSWLVVYIVIALHIASVGQIKPRDDFPMLTTVVYTDETKYVGLYSLFGYLWMNAFLIGVAQFTVSAACAIWYFSCTSDSNGKGSITRGFYWCFRFHFGSIAMGAFLIALVQFIRIIFEYYRRQMEKANKDNKVVKALLCLTSYLLDCLERFVKFISKNAYIQVSTFFKTSIIITINSCFIDSSDRKELLRRCLECLPAHPEERREVRNSQLYRLHLQRARSAFHHCSKRRSSLLCAALPTEVRGHGQQLDRPSRSRWPTRLHNWKHVHVGLQLRQRHHPPGLPRRRRNEETGWNAPCNNESIHRRSSD